MSESSLGLGWTCSYRLSTAARPNVEGFFETKSEKAPGVRLGCDYSQKQMHHVSGSGACEFFPVLCHEGNFFSQDLGIRPSGS